MTGKVETQAQGATKKELFKQFGYMLVERTSLCWSSSNDQRLWKSMIAVVVVDDIAF